MDLQSTTLPLCYLTICRLGKEGFEPPMNASTDLQSAAFSHSATFPVYLSYCFCTSTSTPVHHNHTLRTHKLVHMLLHYMLHSVLHLDSTMYTLCLYLVCTTICLCRLNANCTHMYTLLLTLVSC